MDKFIKWVKKNKKKVIVFFIVLIILIAFAVGIKGVVSFLMPDTKASVYGDRCEITQNNPVSKKRENEIKEFLKNYENMKLIDYDVKCNLIDIVVEVDDGTSFTNVKEMGKKLLEIFEQEELKYYDIELIVSSNNKDSEDYPKIGTHHKEINGNMNDDFIW